MSRRRRRRRVSTEKISVGVIVLAILIVMSVQIFKLRAKNEEYVKKEADLLQQYEDETERASEIDELEVYMKSDEYMEYIAHTKLGLAYDNEIIFKENEEWILIF